MLVPQLVPADLLLPSMQVWAPVVQEVVPFLQMLGLVVHDEPAVQATQPPEPLQTWLVPQLVPGDLLPPSTQVRAPVAQEVVPVLQAVGLVVHDEPAVQATQPPEPLQTWLVPQPTPGALFVVASTQVVAPVAHEVVPFLQAVGLVPHEIPAVQEMHPPAPSQTRFDPQEVPAIFAVPLTHVCAPDVHEAVPL
jgi:hypothetical protein